MHHAKLSTLINVPTQWQDLQTLKNKIDKLQEKISSLRLSISIPWEGQFCTLCQPSVLPSDEDKKYDVKCGYRTEHFLGILERHKFVDTKRTVSVEKTDWKFYKVIEHGVNRKLINIFMFKIMVLNHLKRLLVLYTFHKSVPTMPVFIILLIFHLEFFFFFYILPSDEWSFFLVVR